MKLQFGWCVITAALGMLSLAMSGAVAHGNEVGHTKAQVGNANVAIEYGRPSLKGRDVLKMIQPGQVWRLGADAPTTIESDADLDFGGIRVLKGKHILLARLMEPGKWTLVVSSKSARDFQQDPSAKLAEIPMVVVQDSASVEDLSIDLTGGNEGVLKIAWGTARLTATFTAAH